MFRRWLTEERETHLLGLVRVVFGILLGVHVLRLARMLQNGYFADFFHMPLIPEAWVPSRGVYVAWLWLAGLGALLTVIGVAARPALLFTSLSGLYVMLSDRLHYHNNRYVLLLLALLLALTPCDRSFRVGRKRLDATERRGPLWAARLMQLQLSLVYLASGGGKLLDADWRSGRVIMLRVGRSLDLALADGAVLPDFATAVLRAPLTFAIACKFAILLELALAVLLWVPRLRPFALWLGVLFHVGIELTSNVEIFSWLVLTTYALFAVPELHERVLRYDPDHRSGRALSWLVRRLDWLARFRVEPAPDLARRFEVTDRDGTTASGLWGVARLARALPIAFVFWVPLLLVARARGPVSR